MASNNVIHRIRFTPRRYALPVAPVSRLLVTETSRYIITESGNKIKL